MAITNPTRGASQVDLKQWWTNTYNVWQQNPAEFQAWAAANPDMATRWYAWAQNDGQNLTRDGQRVTARELQAENMDLLQAAGVDLKNDGKLYTTNFNTVDDVNNNWGAGDFWKIGSYNTPRNGVTGLLQNVAESPAAIAGIALAVAMPYLAPQLAAAIASATGWSATAAATAAQSVLSAGMSAAQGGDLSDIITAGVTSALPGLSRQFLPQVLNSISPATAEAYNSLVAAGPTTMEQGQQVWNNLPSIRDIRGVIDPHIPQGDQPTGVKYDMSILNPVVAEPSPTGSSGGSGAPSTPPATSVPPGTPNAPQSPTGPYKGTAGDLDGVPADQRWTWNGKELVNVSTGRTKAVLGEKPMNKGVIYNEEGDPIGGDETSGLDLGYLIWAATQGGNPSTGGNPGSGGLVLGPGAGPNPGGVGTGTTPGTTPGQGSGPDPGGPGTGQNGNGTGNEPPPGPNFDWKNLIPLLGLIPQQENNEGVPRGNATPQDMSTLYQKPTYAPVEQKGLLEPFDLKTRGLQAPMITPAANSNQISPQQWYLEWLWGQQPDQKGVLPMVAPSERGLV